MKSFIFYLIILLSVGSCRTVSREQRAMVNQFALKTENFSAFPEKIWTELAIIRESRGVYYANSFSDPETHLKELDAVFRERMNDNKIPGKVKTIFSILDRYAEGLVLLSSDVQFQNRRKLLQGIGTDLDMLTGFYNHLDGIDHLPVGAGTVLSQTFEAGSRAYLANRQFKALRKYVSQADTLVSALCDAMVEFLSSEAMGLLIQNEETGVTESFRFYLAKRSPPPVESEKEYLALRKSIETVKSLQQQTIRAVKNLKLAHRKLAGVLMQKPALKETAIAMYDFYRDVDQLNSLIRKMNKQ